MLARIKDFFQQNLELKGNDEEHTLRLAGAALLLEMTHVDYEVSTEEQDAVTQAVREHFGLGADETAELLLCAEAERDNSADYHQFTSLINRSYTPEQKAHLIELLWRIAFADETLHKYEEHLVRKVADLLYVPHSTFIAAKHKAQGQG